MESLEALERIMKIVDEKCLIKAIDKIETMSKQTQCLESYIKKQHESEPKYDINILSIRMKLDGTGGI